MKKALQYIFLIGILVCSTFTLRAQPHPGEQSGGAGVGGQRIGDGPSAPVGNGTFILLALALAYAGRKTYTNRTAEEEE